MGIDESTPVVVYGDAAESWGGEGWAVWVLSWLGHKGPVRLLSGGIRAWKGRGLPLSMNAIAEDSGMPVEYRFSLDDSVNITAAEIRAHGKRYELVDVRGLSEWFRRRIPGARRIPWERFFKGEFSEPITTAELKRLLRKNGVDSGRPVVYYCTGGVRSGYAWFVHALSGLGPAINFEGGIEEWDSVNRN